MKDWKEARKLKVIEGYREPGSKTFDSSADSIDAIKVNPGVEAKVSFSRGTSRFYPWHRILNYEK
ncbi:MAG: hypothetical protein ABEK10_02680 [Candidatus Nanosalina sp.]